MRSYSTQVRRLDQLCSEYGLPMDRPLDEESLCVAVCLRAQTAKPTTLPGFVSAIANATRERWGQELPRGRQFQSVMAGLRKQYGNQTSTPKVALTMDDLTAIHRGLDTAARFEHARDWCACLIAFFGLLRIGEYMDARLRHGHVLVAADSLSITVLYSKTSLAPQVVTVSARTDALCPVRAFLAYRAVLIRESLPIAGDDAVFVVRYAGNRAGIMTQQQFILQVKAYLSAAFPHRDMDGYAGHSFRRGGATALLLAGVPANVVQAHGRWSSEAFRLYLDTVHSHHVRMAATRALPGALGGRAADAAPHPPSSSSSLAFTSTVPLVGAPPML